MQYLPSKALKFLFPIYWIGSFPFGQRAISSQMYTPGARSVVPSPALYNKPSPYLLKVFSLKGFLCHNRTGMLKMGSLFPIFFLTILVLTGSSSESVQLLTLHDPSPMLLQAMSHTGVPIAVSVSEDDLSEVSVSVLMAESWVRIHVLAHYPSTKITTIVVGNAILCDKIKEDKTGLVLPSLQNVYYSLTRWGLEKEIKVSAAFSSDCLNTDSVLYRNDLAEKVIKPLLSFLERTNSIYSVNPPRNFSPFSDEIAGLVFSHSEWIKKLGALKLRANVILQSTRESKPHTRKLFVESFPARPTPLPEMSPSPPIHSSVGFSVPANVAKNPLSPLPPLEGTASPPPWTLPFGPESPPFVIPASPPYSSSLPPCSAFEGGGAPAPEPLVKQGLWCVAKPSVPSDTLQEAMDYACGSGGADCEDIKPHGSCYFPDTVLAHSSYAFNSYWQKHKKNGGTCSFGGTAMLINVDPSFLHCRFLHA